MSKPQIRAVWLTPYPLHHLGDTLQWKRPPRIGHPCSWVVNLAGELACRPDIDLHLITLSARVAADQETEHKGYRVHAVKSGIRLLHRDFPPQLPLNAMLAFHGERRRLATRIRELDPDLVHAQGTEFAYALAAMDSQLPAIVSIQGIIEEYQKTNPCLLYRLTGRLERNVVRNCRFFGCRTHFDKGFVLRTNPDAVVFDLPEAMNSIFFDGKWNDPAAARVLFVGSEAPRKGLVYLIKALCMLPSELTSVRLDIVGPVAEEKKAQFLALADETRMEIVFHGFCEAGQIADLHRECTLFVIPSENENSPNTLAEAMASGMPVVAFDTGGIASMMDDGISGLLVPFGDVGGLAAAITRVLRSRELRQRLGRNARQRADRNRPAHVAELTMDAYRRILEESEAGS